MNNVYRLEPASTCAQLPTEGTRRVIADEERVLYVAANLKLVATGGHETGFSWVS
ncbi:MAG: hypothetical protein V5B40_24355 [Candidatus Accumulibacter meliphilus]|jgi:hypothetical protein|uniref:hypothetical protein n=1 Tax=Candidatus Accumulibacter meliphilus TaxID=2211374 RepID=UPI002FC2801D